MKRKSLKLTALGIATMMLLAGCGAENGEQTGDKGGDVTLTVAVQMNEKIEYSSENYAINYIEENTGVKFEFVQLPSDEGDADTKLNLMLSGKDYPDIILYPMNKQKMVKYGQEGIFIPINDLYEQYGDNMKKLFEKRPQYEQISYAPDGNMYGFVTVNECYHCQAYPKLWYNSEWLESLGMKEPTTTEELKEVLMAVKNSDYNGNGKADEIPLTGSWSWDCQLEWFLMNSFVPCDKDTLCYAKDGKVVFACDTEEYKQGLAYMNDLFANGLMDPTCFTQTSDQMQQVVRSDEKLVFGYTADHFGMGIDIEDAHLNKVTTAMVPVESPTGARYQVHKDYVDMTKGFTFFITDNCKNPEAAFRVADFLMGEEVSMIQQFGEEGSYWGKLEEPMPSTYEGLEAIYWVSPNYTANEDDDYWKNQFWSGLQDQTVEFRAKAESRPDDIYNGNGYAARLADETDKVIPYFYPEYLIHNVFIENADEADEFTTIQTSLREYVKSSMAQFISGEMSLETDWDSYVESLEKYNVKRYVELYQKVLDEYNTNN